MLFLHLFNAFMDEVQEIARVIYNWCFEELWDDEFNFFFANLKYEFTSFYIYDGSSSGEELSS